jgi:putative transposase
MKELFRASRDSLGSRTLMENLREEGFKIGRDRTRRLMKMLNLKVKQKHKYKVTFGDVIGDEAFDQVLDDREGGICAG